VPERETERVFCREEDVDLSILLVSFHLHISSASKFFCSPQYVGILGLLWWQDSAFITDLRDGMPLPSFTGRRAPCMIGEESPAGESGNMHTGQDQNYGLCSSGSGTMCPGLVPALIEL
jgi:hypothetical protein